MIKELTINIEEGQHDYAFWDKAIKRTIEWLSRRIGMKKFGIKMMNNRVGQNSF